MFTSYWLHTRYEFGQYGAYIFTVRALPVTATTSSLGRSSQPTCVPRCRSLAIVQHPLRGLASFGRRPRTDPGRATWTSEVPAVRATNGCSDNVVGLVAASVIYSLSYALSVLQLVVPAEKAWYHVVHFANVTLWKLHQHTAKIHILNRRRSILTKIKYSILCWFII